MGFRFRRSVKIAPGVKLNLGKKGMSLTAGKRGASVTFGSKGTYANVGIPGTGLSYRARLDQQAKNTRSKSAQSIDAEIKLAVDEKGYVVARDLDGNDLPKKYVKIAHSQNPQQINSWLANECQKLNEDIDSVLNIHLGTPSLNAFEKFVELEFPDPIPNSPQLKKITIWHSLLPFLKTKVEAYNTDLINKYDLEMANWKKQKVSYEKEQTVLRQKFEHDRYNNSNMMEELLEQALQSTEWPRETLINFDLTDNGKTVLIDLDLPEIEDLPDTAAEIAKSGLKINFKKRSSTQLRKDYMNHIHGIGFRTLGTTFAILPSVNKVVLSVFSQRLESATGHINDEYLYSVKVTRQQWAPINLDNIENIDPVECLSSFELIRKMTKTGVFKAITPLAS